MTLRRARQGDHPPITEIRMSVKENVLTDPGRVTIEDYTRFRVAAGWKVLGTSPRGETILYGIL